VQMVAGGVPSPKLGWVGAESEGWVAEPMHGSSWTTDAGTMQKRCRNLQRRWCVGESGLISKFGTE
jgi:hypothetical protein